jgi:protein FRA10AC1
MRWRVKDEVKAGKGETICANVSCSRTEELESMEVVFGYSEEMNTKNVLVKCVLCPRCKRKLKESYGKKKSRTGGAENQEERLRRSKHRQKSSSDEQAKKRRKQRPDEGNEGRASENTGSSLRDNERSQEHHGRQTHR